MITAYSDGACRVSNPGLCSCACIVYEDDKEISHAARYLGPELRSNNFAEYMGVLYLLEFLRDTFEGVAIYCDSKLVVNQINGQWACLKPDLLPLRNRAQLLMLRGRHTIQHIDGHAGHVGNERADFLCNDVLDQVQGKGKYAIAKEN